jgi:hypothetical protein
MRRIARVLCVLPLAWGSERLAAQSTPKTPSRPSSATGRAAPAPAAPALPADTGGTRLSGAIGVAVDSIHGTALAGAVVIVSGTTRQATTDSLGQFRIDSVPPGAYQLGLFHPLLDSIGLALGTQPVSFPAGRYAVLKLATPSPTALVNLYCLPEKRITGPAVVLGRVLDADTDAPSVGARVSLTWNQVEIGKSVGLRHLSRVRVATVDSSGSFQICGLPDKMTGVLRASSKGLGTAGVPVKIDGQLVTLASLHVPLADTTTVVAAAPEASAAPSPAPAKAKAAAVPAVVGLRRGHAVANGRVLDQAGKAVVAAEVSVAGAEPKAVTNDSGAFTLSGLPSGTQELDVRKVSYAPTSMPIDLSSRAPRTVTVLIRPAPPTLARINVEASKVEKGLKLVGFTDRKRMGLGHFLTEDQIAEKDPQIMTDIFTTMPGITVNYSSGQPTLTSSRTAGGGCVKYYVDDVPYTQQTPGDINDYMRPEEVSAVEVFNSVDVPAQYTQAGNSSCAVIIIWTKTKIGG